MSIREETTLVFTPDDLCELRVDRVKLLPEGGERRVKFVRRQCAAGAVLGNLVPGSVVLPAGCVTAALGVTRDLYIVEQPPQTRTVRWGLRPSDDLARLWNRGTAKKFGLTAEDAGRAQFTLSFPYLLFAVEVTSQGVGKVYLFFRSEPVRSLTDHLFSPCITNCYVEDLHVCMGTAMPCGSRERAAESVEAVISHFWQTGFNHDLPQNFIEYKKKYGNLRRFGIGNIGVACVLLGCSPRPGCRLCRTWDSG